jgi:hypothetical protein
MYLKTIISTALMVTAVLLWWLDMPWWGLVSWGVSVFLLVGESDGGGYV